MKHRFTLFLAAILTLCAASACNAEEPSTVKGDQLKVYQMNAWREGHKVENGPQYIKEILEELDPDVMLLQEISWFCQPYVDEVIAYFAAKGIKYYGKSINVSETILSKYPVKETYNCPQLGLGKDSYAFSKAIIDIKGEEFAFYALHLDWMHMASYNVRGFDSSSTSMPFARIQPQTDTEQLLEVNNRSARKTEITALIADAKREVSAGRVVILGGDFNEPSHLDWGENTKNLRDHKGVVINWPCSTLLDEAGFKDSYRTLYPNAVTHPGFTCNAGNEAADPLLLTYTIGVDDRERLDRTYYYPDPRIEPADAYVVGPKADFWDGMILYEKTQDKIHVPQATWPSDHKGVMTIFNLKSR